MKRTILPLQFRLLFVLSFMGIVLISSCGRLDLGIGPLLYDVTVSPNRITPNADGKVDITEIRYSLRRPANVSIYMENEQGQRFYFRENQRRAEGSYDVGWGGVIDSPNPDEFILGEEQILSQVLPNGEYTWTILAMDDDGHQESMNGSIMLEEVDSEIPSLQQFAVVPQIFRPNQDGMRDDWVSISYYLTKDVDNVAVYLMDPAQPGVKFYINERESVVKPGERGPHDYRYEGGVDLNAEPPPDGTYRVVAEARDRAGNSVRVTDELTIEEGGKPRADVVQSEIHWYALWNENDVQEERNRIVGTSIGQKLCFTATVANEGTVPIRTSGPWPGQEYIFSENMNTLAGAFDESWFQQPGVWRFGINFDTTGIDFPYRWAVGRQGEDLAMRLDERGREQWYLMPGERGEVNGCITFDKAPSQGTEFWWGGLIHERVAIVNNNIDRITVDVAIPEPE
ncbi:MAG: hypothetical protein AAF702_32405 [Chloroflexota bacterium]